MAAHNEKGKLGEIIAAKYLSDNGYVILQTNWFYEKHEIDIIARKEDVLVFVEVKTRESADFAEPDTSVTLKKQKNIIRVAHEYVVEKNWEGDSRFDVISIIMNGKKTEIEHIDDAFYPLA